MKTLWTIAASIFLGSICVAQSAPLSVADIARQNRGDSKPPTVITNDDLSGGSQDSGATSGGSQTLPPEADAATSDGSASSSDNSKKDDSKAAAPKAKNDADITSLKEKLSSYQKEQDGWKRSAQHWEDELASETTSDFRRETAEQALENDKKNIQYFQTKIDQTQSELGQAQQAAAAKKRAEAQAAAQQDNASSGSDQSSGSGPSDQGATSTSPPPVQQ